MADIYDRAMAWYAFTQRWQYAYDGVCMEEVEQIELFALSQFRNVPLERCTLDQLMWLSGQGRGLAMEYGQRNVALPGWYEARSVAITSALTRELTRRSSGAPLPT